MKMLAVHTEATSDVWLQSIRKVAIVSEEWLSILLIFISLGLNSHVWLEAATLHRAAGTIASASDGSHYLLPLLLPNPPVSCRQINLLTAQILSCQ